MKDQDNGFITSDELPYDEGYGMIGGVDGFIDGFGGFITDEGHRG